MDPPNLLLSLLLMFASTVHAQFVENYCGSTGNFTANSTYQTTLTALLSSISTNSSFSLSYGFFNASAAVSGTSQNLYVFGLCRGDLTAVGCGACLNVLASASRRLCPLQKEALLYTGNCIFRYSDTSFFGTLEIKPIFVASMSENNVPSLDTYDAAMRRLLNNLSVEAAGGGLLRKYASGNESTWPDTIYALVQCTPDLTEQQCRDCLVLGVQTIRECCIRYKLGRFMVPSCMILYETNNRFFDPLSEPLLPPPPLSNKGVVLPPPPGTLAAIIVSVAVFVVLLFIGCCCLQRRRAQKKYEAVQEESGVSDIASLQSLHFHWDDLLAATDNFHQENKLGEGGFGEVHQGWLPNGQEIAVKKLSQSSGQGVQEFKNEIVLVAKLQHRNLVRLLGFCLEGGEKLLVYEFVPNKSLDYFVFDLEKRKQLHWPTRYKIISGIARGMLYLHEDSRLRVIHRDLKASNVLLDNDMNPKISDFGMARIFGVDQTNASTRRIVGTYGYMSPEYAMHGHFSQKSDVYSFGILLLEIICGKRNNYYRESDGGEDLVNSAWKHWRDNAPLEIMDPALGESYSRNQVLRCMHISLLCVQEDPANRPTMANIVVALNSQTLSLPLPREPAFFFPSQTEQNNIGIFKGHDQFTSGSVPPSINGVSITEVYPR